MEEDAPHSLLGSLHRKISSSVRDLDLVYCEVQNTKLKHAKLSARFDFLSKKVDVTLLSEEEEREIDELIKQETELAYTATIAKLDRDYRMFHYDWAYNRDYFASVFFTTLSFEHGLFHTGGDNNNQLTSSAHPLVRLPGCNQRFRYLYFVESNMKMTDTPPNESVACRCCNQPGAIHNCLPIEDEAGVCPFLRTEMASGKIMICQCIRRDIVSGFSQKCASCITADCEAKWDNVSGILEYPTLCAVKCTSCEMLYCPFAFKFYSPADLEFNFFLDNYSPSHPIPPSPPPEQSIQPYLDEIAQLRVRVDDLRREIIALQERRGPLSPDLQVMLLEHDNQFDGTLAIHPYPNYQLDVVVESDAYPLEETPTSSEPKATKKRIFACGVCGGGDHYAPGCPQLPDAEKQKNKRRVRTARGVKDGVSCD
jgi:hypothetical protein